MQKQIIYCSCKGDIINKELASQVTQILKKSNVPVYELSDLCGLCALNKEIVQELITKDKETLIIACYSRGVSSLLKFAGLDIEDKNISYLNIRNNSIDTVLESLNSFTEFKIKKRQFEKIEADKDWPSWYPVLDYERCTACGQCSDFCLFGTYEKEDGQVKVVSPQSCKNNCPACARICPDAAIIFPKYTQEGAISGNESIDEAAELQRQRKDVEQILGNDIYKALEGRKAKRQRIIKTEAIDKALEEREKALKEQKRNNPEL